ncbi:MAG: hypothetical protein EBQ96_10050 [Proteobacteria bacterium]|nr:hypothetical protein [Pseudomonadota bacterium]
MSVARFSEHEKEIVRKAPFFSFMTENDEIWADQANFDGTDIAYFAILQPEANGTFSVSTYEVETQETGETQSYEMDIWFFSTCEKALRVIEDYLTSKKQSTREN